MTQVSPRSLQLLQDIISDGDETSAERTSLRPADANNRVGNMNGDVHENFNETLNFFEKLEQENRPVLNGHVKVNGFMNDHVENGVQEDTLQGIAEESADDTLTEEVSETTVDTTSSIITSKKNRRPRRLNNHRRDNNHNLHRQAKTSSVRDNSTDRDSMSDYRETMSDSGRVGRRQRKLKRDQYREFRPIGLEPLETAEERLEKKYKELENLISGQFVEQKKALSINHLQQMELLRQQYAIASHGLPPSGVLIPRSLPSHHRANRRDKENHRHPASEDEAYSTIRTLQASRVSQRRSRARSARTRPLSASRQNQSRSTSRDGRDRSVKNEGNEDQGQRLKVRSRSNSGSRSSSRSPRLVATETHLKNTENELVREWIKKKDRESRQHRVEERRRKKQERRQKIEKQLEREERFKDSHLVVQAWMKQKQKEAYKKQRQERRELRQEVKEKEQQRSHNVSGIHGWGVDRPLSAPAPVRTDRNKIRVQRPGTTVSEVREKEERKMKQSSLENEEAVQQEIPQPPMTKFVYRRPVLGKVRLRNKQPQQEAKRPASAKKSVEKPLSKEEIEQKQRMSYDDWLQQKRKEDLERKRELQRKKELAQSNPEYEVPVPELVQNSENNVLRGKHISGSSGRSAPRPAYVSKIISQEERDRIREMAREKKRRSRTVEEEVNTNYDERIESPEDAIQRVAKNVVSYVLKSLSDDEGENEDDLFEDTDEVEHEGLSNLSILGSRATLSSKTRPMSASARIPGPQPSRSPRRPVSAQAKEKEMAETSFEGCIPFPDDIGAPPHVLKVQQKLFAERISDNTEEEQQKSVQSDSLEVSKEVLEATIEHPVSQMVDQLEKKEEAILEDKLEMQQTVYAIEEKWISESQVYGEEIQENSKKHVSFCEETTIFDEVESDDCEEEDWNDMSGVGEFDMEKIRKMIVQSEGEQGQDLDNTSYQEEHFQDETEGNHYKQNGTIDQQEVQEQQGEILEQQEEAQREVQGEIEEEIQEETQQDEVQEEGQSQVEEEDQNQQEEEQSQEEEEEGAQGSAEERTESGEELENNEDKDMNPEEENNEQARDIVEDVHGDEGISDDLGQQNETVEGEDKKQEDAGAEAEGDSVFLTSGPEGEQVTQMV